MTTLTRIILDADTIPRVDIDFMNNTHFEEIEMVKTLGERIIEHQSTNNETKKITQMLAAWLQHTQAHFARENELMLATNFPMYPVHSAEHENALKHMTGVVKAWQYDHDIKQLAEYVFILWPAWFNAHVDTIDMMTARHAVMNGYLPEQDLK